MAANYLKKKGYEVIARNWTCRWGELDLVCRYNNELVFVEVKYRSSNYFGYPQQAVSNRKMRILHRTIKYYLLENAKLKNCYRVEVVSIYEQGKKLRLDHYRSVS